MALVKQAGDAASSSQKRDNMAGLHEHNFVSKVIELHDKYLAYASVDGCFNNDSLFHNAIHEALEVFRNKSVVGSSSAELHSDFGDKVFMNGGVEQLSQEPLKRHSTRLSNGLPT